MKMKPDVNSISTLLNIPEHLIILLNKDGYIRYFSPSCEKLSGYTSHEVIGKPFWDVFIPENICTEVKSRFFNNIINQDVKEYNRELPIITKHGDRHTIAFRVTPTETNGSDLDEDLYIVYGVNVSDEHNDREELERVIYTMREIIEKTPIGMYIINNIGKVEYVNPYMLQICGDTAEQFLNMNCLELPTYVELGISEKIKKGLGGVPFKTGAIEYTSFYGKKSSLRTFTGIPIKDRTGKNKLLIVVQDLTEINKLHKIEQEKKLLDNIINITGTIIVVLDTNGRIIRFNEIASKVFGWSGSYVEGKMFWDVLRYENKNIPKVKKFDFLKEGIFPSHFETQLQTSEMIKRIISWKITYMKDIYGSMNLVVCAGVDMTEERRAKDALEKGFTNFAKSISHAIASTDPYTANHQKQVAELSDKVGRKLGLNGEQLKGLYVGALLHDIGKIGIPEIILIKPGTLSIEEWNLVKTHTKIGYEILEDAALPWPVAKMAMHHHERLDGSGYPKQLKGDQIQVETRILAVCDVVEAMSSHRPYRPSRTLEEVYDEIRKNKSTKYDPAVCDIILNFIETNKLKCSRNHWLGDQKS